MSIDKLLGQFKTIEEKDAFIQAQYKTLLQVQKKNKELQDEIEHLKKLVAGAVPIVGQVTGSTIAIGSDEEEIAKIELRKLKGEAMTNEPLTLEQAKRVEIYSKILNSRGPKDKNNGEREVTEINSDDLLAIAETPDENKVN